MTDNEGMTETRTSRVLAWARDRLVTPRLPWILAGVSMLLVLPSLWTGLQFDDYPQREKLLGKAGPAADDSSLTGMFSFMSGDIESAREEMNRGILPWWSFEAVRIRFFRPLSEITHMLDYRLWPDVPLLMHLHSVLWFGLMILAATLLYRRVMSSAWVAGLAACLYALDEAHGLTAGWIAHRSATIATVLGILTLLLHIRWQQDRWRPGAVLAPVCLALGLLAAEGAIAAGAYLLAYQLFLARGGFLRRMIPMVPYGIVAVAWFVAYRVLGFGTEGSGMYVDPAGEPLLYMRALFERGALLLFSQWFNGPLFFFGLVPPRVYLVIFITILVCLLAVGILLVPLLRHDRTARFWAAGMVLSLVPICATSPNGRLLLFVGLGAMAICAQLIAAWFEGAEWLPSAHGWQRLARVCVVAFLLLHLVMAPLLLPVTSCQLAVVSKMTQERPLRQLLAEYETEGKTIVLIDPPVPLAMYHVAAYLSESHGLARPDRMLILSQDPQKEKRLTRSDAHTIELAIESGLIDQESIQLLRGPLHPIQQGHRADLSHMAVEVREMNADRLPSRVRFTFPVPLEDPSLVLMLWDNLGLTPLDPPRIGQTVRIPPERLTGWPRPSFHRVLGYE